MELTDSRQMDWQPLEVVSIRKESGKPTKYVLNYESLEELLRPISDKPVVIIPIVGPSRQGKSFILNYMIRFLSDPKNINWIGDNAEPLKGFGWKSDVDPQTSGLWLSKPFILKQSNGKEVSVLLMDTQGVFDAYSSQRDWCTIVGISLLMSSCLIFNIFNILQDDVLITLESFLQYGLMAARANPDSNEKPFQSLMFLIRDWNIPFQFKYGLSGGKAFLEHKLMIDDKTSESGRVIRKLLPECFKEMSCFLMPNIGDDAKEEDFNGSVDGLSSRFVDKMKEFIFHLLNPEELKPKTIDNNIITGQEVLQYFKSYVQVFNSDELPKPNDLVEATAKTKDLINLNKLKESNISQLKAYIRMKPFMGRKRLIEEFDVLKKKTIETFDGLKKSTNTEILKELYDLLDSHLNSNYEHIWSENESRRVQYINKVVDKCQTDFDDKVNDVLDSTFVESDVLDDCLAKFKKEIMNQFQQHLEEEEEEELFARDINKLNKEISNLENKFKAENRRRIAEANRINGEALEDAIGVYKQSMKDILEGNVYLTKEVFKPLEKEAEDRAKDSFRYNCSAGGHKFKETFAFRFDKKLKETKEEYKEQNKSKCERVEHMTEKLVNSTVDEYNQRMDNLFDSFSSVVELSETHEDVRQQSMEVFIHSCIYKDQTFLCKYLNQFEKVINKSFDDSKKSFAERLERLQNSFNAKLIESKEFYIQKMDNSFNGKVFTDEEMEEMHDESRNEAIALFESHSITITNVFDVSKYISDLKQNIANEFERYVQKNIMNRDLKQRDLKDVVNEYWESYDEKMEVHIDEANSDRELIEKHETIRTQIISEFKQKNSSTDVSDLETYLKTLEQKIEDSFNDAMELLELRLKNQQSVANNLITDVRKFYRQEMEKYFQKTSFLSKENLMKNNESVINRTIDKFEGERGVMSLDNYKNIIESSVKDIFEKIVAQNDMNTPTLPAIGIDLGTTNSCVAYYKPDCRGVSSAVVIPNELGHNVTPSFVSIRDGGKVVGDVAKEEIGSNHYNTIYSAKRLIGRQFSDESVQKDMEFWSYKVVNDGNDNPQINVAVNGSDEKYYPEQISAEVLKKMKEIAENHLGLKVTKAVITVPAYFNDAQKEATKDAGKLAGLEVLKIINEPTAAAVAFQLNKSDDFSSRKVLIYDFGGGTFDVAVIKVEKGEIKVMAVGGDNHLGGDDFDNKLVKYCLTEFNLQTGYNVTKTDSSGAIAVTRLRRRCEEAKCKLSATDTTTVFLNDFYQSEDLSVDITRDKFEDLCEDLFIKSMDLVAQTLQDSGLTHKQIDDIVLVGGSTRIPRVQELLSGQFDDRPLNHTVNPDEAVAVGAAIQAAILNGQEAQDLKYLRVVDVAPLSLGVKVKDGYMSVIVHRNSKIPNSYEKLYQTVSDYQTSVEVEVFEGEEQMADNNRSLGKFELKGIPAAPKGEQNIKVLFEITDEGILRVSAKIVSTGGEEEIEIKEHKGRLSDKELEQLILQGSSN